MEKILDTPIYFMGDIPIYFMVQSPSGKTHAINPKTQKTYCGNTASQDLGWRPLDVRPSSQNEPTCQICRDHYDEPLREKLTSLANELKESVSAYLDTRIILKDVDGLKRVTTTIKNFLNNECKRKKEDTS